MRVVVLVFAVLLLSETAYAKPSAVGIFCSEFGNSPLCTEQANNCGICHKGPPSLDKFGEDLKSQMSEGNFEAILVETVKKLGSRDSDGDGVSNAQEIADGTYPGDTNSVRAGKSNLAYDTETAFKRMMMTYCGTGPTYQTMQSFRQSGDQKRALHDQLDDCLASDYWKSEGVRRIADKKIQPLATVGFKGDVVIGDFRWDYNLFAHVMTDNRDMRELLSAQYHVDDNGRVRQGKIAREERPQVGQRIVIAGGQPLDPGRRAGMITTQWFFARYTMFADVPRSAAAQAYRSYLGYDIAYGEGLFPIANEPRDPDNKNVKQGECASCHNTLDPLAYAFVPYVGIETIEAFLFNTNGTYDPFRRKFSNLEGQGYLFGNKVNDLMDWARQGRESDQFKIAMARMFFKHALSRLPKAGDQEEFKALWQSIPADNYSANGLIHRLVDTVAFGGVQK